MVMVQLKERSLFVKSAVVASEGKGLLFGFQPEKKKRWGGNPPKQTVSSGASP